MGLVRPERQPVFHALTSVLIQRLSIDFRGIYSPKGSVIPRSIDKQLVKTLTLFLTLINK